MSSKSFIYFVFYTQHETDLEEMEVLSKEVGSNIFLKREDT